MEDKAAELEREWETAAEALGGLYDYLKARREELSEALSPGMGLETWDAFLKGYSVGMLAGIDLSLEYVNMSISNTVGREYLREPNPFKRMATA